MVELLRSRVFVIGFGVVLICFVYLKLFYYSFFWFIFSVLYLLRVLR